ncbi:MAG TPA: tRNA (adenosine(37)-N6)-threonylcarbamoyltransferase complex dimerization subunit type 1 TsaB [Dermatophilaceae bacterium]|nr:tRNA (adenosine(37)-N6)-threonylcarbamoyltransferase complex dimerization subunit type 1 TsaB [Dermatophilaceae bacterium]
MLILGIDTSTSAVAVAVSDGTTVLARAERLDPRAHTEALAPLVRDVLTGAGATPADLTDVAVGTGPGPFTGLRVGLVTAAVLGHALGVPVHGLCSLDALAQAAVAGSWSGAAGRPRDVLVATDARRKEVYWARYAVRPDTGGRGAARARRLEGPHVDRPADLPEEVRALPTAGRGPLLHPALLPHAVGPLDVDAGVLLEVAVARLGAGEPMPVEPLYLRRPDALTSAERAAR